MNKKEFYKDGDKSQHRYFNHLTWIRMRPDERDLWSPMDGKDWPELPLERSAKDESWKLIQQTQKEKNLDNLRLKVGTKIDLMGIQATVLKWGSRQHLISLDYAKKRPGKPMRYGILERTCQDSSWGIRDTLSTFQKYQTFDTLQEAELRYEFSNR